MPSLKSEDAKLPNRTGDFDIAMVAMIRSHRFRQTELFDTRRHVF